MKKLLLFLFITTLIVSCEKDSHSTNQNSSEVKQAGFEIKSFTGAKVGSLVDGKIVIKATNILEAAQNHSDKFGLEMTPERYEVVVVDEKDYLRIFNTDGSVATVALFTRTFKNGDDPDIGTGETVCKSTVCASGGGCVPDGEYCTECINPSTGNQSLDCSRTTTGGNGP